MHRTLNVESITKCFIMSHNSMFLVDDVIFCTSARLKMSKPDTTIVALCIYIYISIVAPLDET